MIEIKTTPNYGIKVLFVETIIKKWVVLKYKITVEIIF